jgi:formylglycine-generating enzyme required for sulfatase activity/UDP-2,3-diacylglucosamine pyrophosphatase LpxH/energy-coupling factor transporter ATP-binding protein EcfA2
MIHILHLSDIHLGTGEEARIYLCQLESDLKNELHISRLDYLVISGDIANESIPDDYKAAFHLIDGIIKGFDLKSRKIIIVPGNHDLNWGLSKKGYRFVYMEEAPNPLPEGDYIPAGESGVLIRDEKEYPKRFDHFIAHFYAPVHGSPYPANCEEQAIIHAYPEHRLLFLALNTCWEIDHNFHNRSGINMVSLSGALREIMGNEYKEYLKIAVCHHPVNGPEMMKDVAFMEQLSVQRIKVLMHGHIHENRERFFYGYDYGYDDNRCIHVIGAGTFGAPAKDQVPGIPLQYNLLMLDPERQVITVETRKKEKPAGAWSADARWGDRNDPKPRYVIYLKKEEKSADSKVQAIHKPPEIPGIYTKWLMDHCMYMDIDKLREKGRVIQVKLPETFIPLYANPLFDKGKTLSREKDLLKEKERTADIERLIFENDYLLVEGLAGSGKTTLMKHFAYTTIHEINRKAANGWLPVLVFLKDLKPFEEEGRGHPANATTVERILSRYFELTGNGLDMELVKDFCKAGRAVFLLDGLDEIDRQMRDLLAEYFADFRNRYECCKTVFSGRSNGFEGPVVDRFGDRHVKVLPLNTEQVETFINKWFRFIYEEDSKIGRKTARDMISEVRCNPGIDRLIDNPLMLTAICILYLDGKELPGQRSELYKKFIDNLLFRRFGDESEKVRNFLNTLAFTMQTRGGRGIDRRPAVEVLGSVYRAQGNETKEEHCQRLEALFDRIEPDCGLLKLEEGQYNFRHLTFQEFLTATALVDKETNYSRAIKDYWDDERYKEVIELYIGYLSIENKRWANKILEEILEKGNQKPFNRWRLAARSLMDIHRDRREEAVVERAKERLIQVFDSDVDSKQRADAGEILGWLGDPSDLKGFVGIEGGKYGLSKGKMKIAAFEMGRYPVTNQWFEEFLMRGGYENEAYWSPEGKKWLHYTGAKNPRLWHNRQWRCPNAPVVGICWYEAYAFTRWLTEKRKDGYEYMLPNENEWEAAASGLEGREYPWASSQGNNRCNTEESGIGKASSVGIFKEGVTPEGIFDLAGNVWEWTCSDYHSGKNLKDFIFDREIAGLFDEYERTLDNAITKQIVSKYSEKGRQLPMLRGGSWDDDLGRARCVARTRGGPGVRGGTVGFRCARKR